MWHILHFLAVIHMLKIEHLQYELTRLVQDQVLWCILFARAKGIISKIRSWWPASESKRFGIS